MNECLDKMSSQAKLAKLLRKKVNEHDKILSTDGKVLNCEVCNQKINYTASHGNSTLTKHLASQSHRDNL